MIAEGQRVRLGFDALPGAAMTAQIAAIAKAPEALTNIMLANVLERRREIGLKRALGPCRRDIVKQCSQR